MIAFQKQRTIITFGYLLVLVSETFHNNLLSMGATAAVTNCRVYHTNVSPFNYYPMFLKDCKFGMIIYKAYKQLIPFYDNGNTKTVIMNWSPDFYLILLHHKCPMLPLLITGVRPQLVRRLIVRCGWRFSRPSEKI